MFQGCFKGVSRVFQGGFKGVSRMFQRYFKDISRVIKGCFKYFQVFFKEVSFGKRFIVDFILLFETSFFSSEI